MLRNKKHYSGTSEHVLEAACTALNKWNSTDLTLDECIDDLREEFPVPEARAAASLLFAYFRNKEWIDSLMDRAAAKGRVSGPAAVLGACTLAQVFFQTGIAPESAVNVAVDFARAGKEISPGFMNALLRQSIRLAGDKPYPLSFPEKLRARWKKAYGAETAEHAEAACTKIPGNAFRLRNGAPLPEHAVPVDLDFTGTFRFAEIADLKQILDSKEFAEGFYYIQDPAPAMSVELCGNRKPSAVLDACAAPGGKTVMLAEKFPEAKITAADKSPRRLRQMEENFKRLGIPAKTLCADALQTPQEKYDLIFADVPCTNTGVGRHRPDALRRFSKNRLEATVKLQRRILAALAPAVKPDGILLYSTCSIEPEENLLQIQDFLKDFPDFELEESRTLLPDTFHDGAFAARLHRK